MQALDEIPDVIGSMGFTPADLKRDSKAFFEARLAAAGLPFVA